MTATLQATETGTSTWRIDPAHSLAEFGVRHLMISTVKGRFTDVQGNLRLAADDPTTGQVEVTIGVESIDTGVADRDKHLRSADFFDVERFPSIGFKSRSVTRVGENELKVTGDLTLRDVTREVTLAVEELGSARDPWGGERIGFSARVRINRKDFGLTWNQVLETGGVVVGEDVKIVLEIQLVRESE